MRLTKFTVEDDAYVADVEMSDGDAADGGAPGRELAVDGGLLTAILAVDASVVLAQLLSEDKATRKLAKQSTKKANAHFHQLQGLFVLGAGPRGLTVYALPDRRVPLAELAGPEAW